MNQEKFALVTAFGCGIAISATIASLFIKFKYIDKSAQFDVHSLSSQIQLLSNNIEQLRKDVEEIKLNSQRGSPLLLSSMKEWDQLDPKLTNIEEEKITKDYHPLLSSSQTINLNDVHTSDENEEFFDFPEGDNNFFYTDSINNLNSSFMNINNIYNQWLNEIDLSLDDLKIDKKLLFDKIEEGELKFGKNSDILWRKAKASHLLAIVAEKNGDNVEKKRLTFLTFDIAQKAIDADSNNPECHKWLAIAIGSLSDYISSKEKVANGFKFKEHVDRAIKLKPNDATLHHMLGRWNLEVASLTWIEKKVAATLFARLPEATYYQALDSLLTAQKFKSDWKDNIFYICKTYIKLQNYDEALQWVKKGIEFEIKSEDDELAHKKLLQFQAKYKNYLSK